VVSIRKARPDDWEQCATLDHSTVTDRAWRVEVREQEGRIHITFEPIRLPRSARLPYPRQGEPLAAGWEGCDLFLVADAGRQICGYITVRALRGHGLAWVQDLVVDRAWRRRGIGSDLLVEAMEWAQRNGLERLVAEVTTKNDPGICFLRAHGLVFCGYHEQHWRTQDIAILFARPLR